MFTISNNDTKFLFDRKNILIKSLKIYIFVDNNFINLFLLRPLYLWKLLSELIQDSRKKLILCRIYIAIYNYLMYFLMIFRDGILYCWIFTTLTWSYDNRICSNYSLSKLFKIIHPWINYLRIIFCFFEHLS